MQCEIASLRWAFRGAARSKSWEDPAMLGTSQGGTGIEMNCRFTRHMVVFKN